MDRTEEAAAMSLGRTASEGDMHAKGVNVRRRFAYSPTHPSLVSIRDVRGWGRSAEEGVTGETDIPPVPESPFSSPVGIPRAESRGFSPQHHDWAEGQIHLLERFKGEVAFGELRGVLEKTFEELTATEKMAWLILKEANLVGVSFTHERAELAQPVFRMRLGDDIYVVVNPNLRPART